MTVATLGPLTKVSANFTQRSVIALEAAAEISGDTQTDCLNRAVQLYAFIEKARAEGKTMLFHDPSTGGYETVELT
jgi:hypothetical protein